MTNGRGSCPRRDRHWRDASGARRRSSAAMNRTLYLADGPGGGSPSRRRGTMAWTVSSMQTNVVGRITIMVQLDGISGFLRHQAGMVNLLAVYEIKLSASV